MNTVEQMTQVRTPPQIFYSSGSSVGGGGGRRNNAHPRGSKDETRQDPDRAKLCKADKRLGCGPSTTEGTLKFDTFELFFKI